MDWKKRTDGVFHSVTRIESIKLLSVELRKSRVYDGGKSEGRQRLVEVINEAVLGISNELGRMQW
jgi:hypothetical protein